MLFLAFRNFLQERGRLVISVIGVAFSVVLILIMLGIENGVTQQFTRVVDRNPTNVFVAAKGIQDFFHGVSLFPANTLDQFRAEPGVKDVVPAISQRALIEKDGKHLDLVVFGFDPAKPQGAPWEVRGGPSTPANGEALVSDTLVRKLGKKVGDDISFSNRTFKITGLVPDGSSLGTHYVWLNLDTVKTLLTVPNTVSFGYIVLNNPGTASQTADTWQTKYSNLTVVDKPTFLKNNRETIEESFLPIIRAIVVIALLIGIAVIGLTIYTATIDKAREYGILKAIGVSNRQLYSVVLTQAVFVTIVGGLLGTGISLLLAAGLQRWINVPPQISDGNLIAIAALAIGMAIIASFIPVRRLTHIDPAEVFKS